MAETKRRGSIAELAVLRVAVERGYRVAIPYGEDAPYDLIVERGGKLERVQCKYVRSDGRVIEVRCTSTNNWRTHRYTDHEIGWIATYDVTTDLCYFVPSSMIGDGKSIMHLRLDNARNNQTLRTRRAADFLAW